MSKSGKTESVPAHQNGGRLAKKKKANQIVEDMNLPPLKKPKRLTVEERKNLVGQKRMKGQKVKPISRRGKIITAEFSAQNPF